MAAERSVLVRLRADVSDFNKGLLEAGAAVSGLRKEINTTNDRTAWLTQGIAAIAPALVPLGAAGVPVIAGLAAQMTVAGVAAGVLVLGFQGIGDAAKALNTYQLTPTVENLTKLQQAMDKIGPAGAQFVEFLDKVQPQLTSLQDDARAGMFPGMEDGITHLLTLMPKLHTIVSQVAAGIGQLSSEAGKNLAGPKFEEFFQFLETDAKPILIEMGHTVGNLVDGLTALFVDLLPEAKGFSTGLEGASASFAKWAHSVDNTQGFHDFLAYVNQSGPQALAFIEALGKALLALVEAGAPIGSHLLPLFTKLLDVLAAIASTPLGSTLLAFASLISLYGRFVAIGSNLTTGKWGAGIAAQTQAIKTGLPTWREFGNTAMHSMHSVNQLNDSFATGATRAIESRAAVTGWLKSIGPLAGQAALLGVIMTGADQKIHLANTASLALAGSFAGPVGAAVGGAVGLFLDYKSAANDAAASTQALNATFSSSTATISDYRDALARATVSAKAYADQFGSTSGILKAGVTNLPGLINFDAHALTGTDQVAQQQAAVHAATMQQFSAQQALLNLGGKLGSKTANLSTPFAANSASGIQQLTDLANKAQPAMDALGISLERLSTEPGPLQDKDVAAIAAWIKNADSAKGRAENMSSALTGLDGSMATTQQSAQALTGAMNDLFGPKLGVNAAHNAWLESLRALHTQLDANSKAVLGNSNAALKNQDAIRGVVTNTLAYLSAQAANGASSEQVTASYKRQRAALIANAGQLGINKGAMIQLLHQYGLTPKALNTLIKLNGAPEALSQAQAVARAIASIQRDVGINIHVNGVTNALLAEQNLNRNRKADGGWIYGPGGPRDDMIPALVSNGEFIVNAAAASRNRALLESMNARKFADGGSVNVGSGGKDDSGMRGLQRAINELTKSVDADKKSRDDLRQAEQQQAQSVRDGFRSQFLDTGDVWGGGSPFSILKGDTRNANAYIAALKDLRKRGVSGGFAAQIDTLGGAQQVDALSNRQLHQLEHLFTVRQHASSAAGQLSGQTAYGHQLDEANRTLHSQERHLRAMEVELKHLRAEAKHHAKATGDAVGNKLNQSAGRANRRVRKP